MIVVQWDHVQHWLGEFNKFYRMKISKFWGTLREKDTSAKLALSNDEDLCIFYKPLAEIHTALEEDNVGEFSSINLLM